MFTTNKYTHFIELTISTFKNSYKRFFFTLLILIIFVNCGRNTPSDSSDLNNSSDNITISEEKSYGDDETECRNIRLTGVIETCNKCMGYGLMQDGLYGQPQVCKFCWVSTYMRMQQGWKGFNGRYGQVDAVFNGLPFNYFDDLNMIADGNDENSNGQNGRQNSNQIEMEITRHEENIAQLEGMLEYIDGSINRNQIQQQIIEEKYEIKRLKQMLNN